MSTPTIPISCGELCDKLSILEIKSERVTEPNKLLHIQEELIALRAIFNSTTGAWSKSVGHELKWEELVALLSELKAVYGALWDVENRIRNHEQRGDFGSGFIKLARDVYCMNDDRSRIKKLLNGLLNSTIVEEKSYHSY